MESVFDILKQRGFIQQCSNESELKRILDSESVTLYTGFDPTGSSLHIGHLVPLMAMSHLQKAGHKPIALIGGGTAMIGDPTGKTEMRKMLTKEQIKSNSESFKKQISRFLDFDNDKAYMINNLEWLENLNYIDFLRDIGKHFSVNRMLSFETYKMRLETGLSFIEFNYQLLQSYDFLILNQRQNCTLQVGGDDQWGNIVSGIDLVRRLESKEVFALTCPLVTRSDGKKMGKTEKGALFLNPELISPYEFYQYWVNVTDADVKKFLYLYTFLPADEIEELSSLKDKEINMAKQKLAYEITSLVHGEEEALKAKSASEKAFGSSGKKDIKGIPSLEFSSSVFDNGINIIDLFSQTSLCQSKSDARRLINQGGAYINDENIMDLEYTVDTKSIKDKSIILRAGKKRYFKVEIK
jgi:tyrosyl-tRNA synthetase